MLVAIPHIWHCNASIPKSIHLLHNILFVIFFFAVVVVMPCGAHLPLALSTFISAGSDLPPCCSLTSELGMVRSTATARARPLTIVSFTNLESRTGVENPREFTYDFGSARHGIKPKTREDFPLSQKAPTFGETS